MIFSSHFDAVTDGQSEILQQALSSAAQRRAVKWTQEQTATNKHNSQATTRRTTKQPRPVILGTWGRSTQQKPSISHSGLSCQI